MGVSIGDYNRDGLLDIVKTNFAGDTDSLYMNLGDGSFDDRTYQAGLGINTRLLGWGVSFIDIDNDGWLDILVANGHVYPEVDGTQVDAAYAERKYLYRNLRNGQFEDVSMHGGSGNHGSSEGARLRCRRLRQRRRSGRGGELRQCRSATAALRRSSDRIRAEPLGSRSGWSA